MDPTTIVSLANHIKAELQCECRFLHASPLRHIHKGRALWEGEVGVFAIQLASGSEVCFAWQTDFPQPTARPVVVIKTPIICTPELAVESHIRRQCRPA